MSKLKLTETQKSLSHILAAQFKGHEDAHRRIVDVHKHCEYCDALVNLELYIMAREDKAARSARVSGRYDNRVFGE